MRDTRASKSSFCGRFDGRWNDTTTDAGMGWAMIQQSLKEAG